MSKYEARLESDLAHISEKLANLGEAVESALKDASRALFTAEEELAYKVILGDFPINRASRELDKICHGFFAVHLPSAGHLRFISSVMRVNLELERIGDYAVNICREAVQIGHLPEGILGQQMEGMSREVQDILGKAIAAFKGGDPEQFKLYAAAYAVLIDPEKKRVYDATGDVELTDMDIEEFMGSGVLEEFFQEMMHVLARLAVMTSLSANGGVVVKIFMLGRKLCE